jgi:hypothetical protein
MFLAVREESSWTGMLVGISTVRYNLSMFVVLRGRGSGGATSSSGLLGWFLFCMRAKNVEDFYEIFRRGDCLRAVEGIVKLQNALVERCMWSVGETVRSERLCKRG